MTLFIVGVITAMFCLVSGVALGVGIAQTLDDKMFKKSIIINMARQGYVNVSC